MDNQDVRWNRSAGVITPPATVPASASSSSSKFSSLSSSSSSSSSSVSEVFPAIAIEGGCKVLLADRSAATRQVLGQCLERCHCRVVLGGSIDEAWEQFMAHEDCRVAVVDRHLVGRDGTPLLRALRNAPREHYTYIITTTPHADRASLRAAMLEGADDVLVKPFFHEVLAQRIQVAQRLLQMEDRLFERQRELERINAAMEAINERTRRELMAAVEVQRSLLPGDLGDIDGAKVAWRYIPSTELGGDMIGCFPIGRSHLAFYVLDVSGHGVSAALLTVQVSRFLDPGREGAGILLADDGTARAPAQVLRALNDHFPLSNNRQYFTVIYGVLNLDDGRLQWSSAGHPWPLASDGKGTFILEAPGTTAIGWLPTSRTVYQDHSLRLQAGERLVFYSDGAIECMNHQLAMFGSQRLVKEVDHTRRLPLDAALDYLQSSLDTWSREGPERDDLSLLLLEYVGR